MNRTLTQTATLLLLSGSLLAQPTPAPVDANAEPKPYDSVITGEAKSSSGIFKVHTLKGKLFFEIPLSQLDKDFLLVTTIARSKNRSADGGAAALKERVVRWHRMERRVLLQDLDYRTWADPKLPISKAVAVANNPTILMAFPIEAEAGDGSLVMDVGKLYLTDVAELSPKRPMGAQTIDPNRSFIERAKAYPENVEVESTLTLTGDQSINSLRRAQFDGSASLLMHYSLVKLPEQPMQPRLSDDRVGFFETQQTDFGRPDHYSKTRRYIARWRLEKKDPKAPLSDPIKPIVFYIDPATPAQWVPWIKRGVEQWQSAFEEAGFRQAILAKDVLPNDPDWSAEDARFSTIRWIACDIANAYGPHISDPRTGEILEADIHVFHSILDLQRRWYFTQVGHLDSRCQRLPIPDDLMGQLVEFVVAHEVGHSLGFRHNMLASSTYPLEKVRDSEWVKKWGHCPSIMDYCRFNYVAQPEDKIELSDLIPRVGPYDRFATAWGYKPIPGAQTPDAEKPVLDSWALEQDQEAWKRYAGDEHLSPFDPGIQSEAVGDADPVAATGLGYRSLRQVARHLVTAASATGDDYSELRHFYDALVGQWFLETQHVTRLIGGNRRRIKHAGQAGVVFTPVDGSTQRRALDFLLNQSLQPLLWLEDPEVVQRIYSNNADSLVPFLQEGLAQALLSQSRLNRLVVQSKRGGPTLTLQEYLDSVRRGIFSELTRPVAVHPNRRQIQRALVAQLEELLLYGDGDPRALARLQIKKLITELAAGESIQKDPTSRAHLADLRISLEQALDPHARPKSRQPIFRMLVRTYLEDPAASDTQGCWGQPILEVIEKWRCQRP